MTLLARAKSQLRAGATQQAENALTAAFVKLLSVAQEKEHDASSHESTVKCLQAVMEALDVANDLIPELAGCLNSAKVLYQKLVLANKSKELLAMICNLMDESVYQWTDENIDACASLMEDCVGRDVIDTNTQLALRDLLDKAIQGDWGLVERCPGPGRDGDVRPVQEVDTLVLKYHCAVAQQHQTAPAHRQFAGLEHHP